MINTTPRHLSVCYQLKRTLRVSPVNFTEVAQERNIDMGLLVRLRWLAEWVTGHFETSLSAGLLEPVL
jgi:hypothetical protein